jgi:hypothetical protein
VDLGGNLGREGPGNTRAGQGGDDGRLNDVEDGRGVCRSRVGGVGVSLSSSRPPPSLSLTHRSSSPPHQRGGGRRDAAGFAHRGLRPSPAPSLVLHLPARTLLSLPC